MIMTGTVMMGLSMQSITQILNTTKETGELTTNERRELLGYPPVEGGDVRQVSLNFIDSEKQNEYQTGGKDNGTAGNDAGEQESNE